jgi:hypothetical protein
MSKNHRGKGIRELYKRGRGTCPVCKRTGVKIIHEREKDKQKIFVCKVCNVVMSRREKQLKKKLETMAETETKKETIQTTEVKPVEKEETMATKATEKPEEPKEETTVTKATEKPEEQKKETTATETMEKPEEPKENQEK